MANNNSLKQQSGSAIVVALFIVALVVVAATAMLTRMQQDIRRTELILNAEQSYYYAQGSIAWATDQLINDWKLQQPQQIIDKTPIQLRPSKVGNATIQTTIFDAQGFYNINNLTDEKNRDGFIHLIQTVMPKINKADAQNIVLATIAWVAPTAKNSDADEYYAKLHTPYRSPHRLMANVSELRLVKGMTSELYKQLLPYVIALPATTNININNADEPVLMTLSPTMTLSAAKAIVSARKQSAFPTTQAFANFDTVKNNNIATDRITISSTYFLVKTQVTIGDQTTILYTLMQRDLKNSQPSVTILWQTKGGL